jgi:hypothetical protein
MPVWPPTSGVTTGFITGGTEPTTIAWGTDGLYPGVIVKSLRLRRMVEEVRIENGTGITATQVLLIDGKQVEITVVDDQALTFPDTGQVLTLNTPQLNGPGVAISVTFTTIDNDYNAARKAEGERVLLAKAYVLITPF